MIEPQARQRSRRRFLLKLILFVLPFALAFFVLTGFLIYTGEAMPLWLVARIQMTDSPVLYRPRYGDRDPEFKMISANLRQPQVMTLGSSRVLQFRSLFFDKDPHAFYNAGGPGWTLDQVQQVLQGLTFTPKVVIIGLDQPWFNDAYVNDSPVPPPTNDFANIFMINRSFLQDVVAGQEFDIGHYLKRVEPGHGGLALGLRAIRDGHGFRNDGSEQYGDFLVAHWLDMPTERRHHLDMLHAGQDMYVDGDTVSPSRLQQLNDVLAWCQQRGIFVIGFQPSFMPSLYPQLIGDGQHTYVTKLDAAIQPIFQKYGDAYFNFADSSKLGATDDDFFDGWHASEQINMRLYMQMLKALPDPLGQYSDLSFLQTTDANVKDTFEVFGNRVS
ncbi:MAG TPA: hypothetical protein VHD90_22500 [Phototrophicaceae bacterium]|nr:hypothetical protein [Phototrophicaceae bacterium]